MHSASMRKYDAPRVPLIETLATRKGRTQLDDAYYKNGGSLSMAKIYARDISLQSIKSPTRTTTRHSTTSVRIRDGSEHIVHTVPSVHSKGTHRISCRTQ